MTKTAILRLNVCFTLEDEKDNALHILQKDYEIEIIHNLQNSIICDIYVETANIDKTTQQIKALFNNKQIEEGYIDTYVYTDTTYLHDTKTKWIVYGESWLEYCAECEKETEHRFLNCEEHGRECELTICCECGAASTET